MRMGKRIKRTGLLLALFAFTLLAARVWAGQGERGPGRLYSAYDPSLNIWLDLEEEEDEYETGRIPYEPRAAGLVTLVPHAPSRWTASCDLGANTFEMAAPISLPPTIRSADVASVRAIFNDRVDRASVDTIVREDFAALYVSGRPLRFRGLNDVELVQIILERVDGVVLVQNLAIGLRGLVEE